MFIVVSRLIISMNCNVKSQKWTITNCMNIYMTKVKNKKHGHDKILRVNRVLDIIYSDQQLNIAFIKIGLGVLQQGLPLLVLLDGIESLNWKSIDNMKHSFSISRVSLMICCRSLICSIIPFTPRQNDCSGPFSFKKLIIYSSKTFRGIWFRCCFVLSTLQTEGFIKQVCLFIFVGCVRRRCWFWNPFFFRNASWCEESLRC